MYKLIPDPSRLVIKLRVSSGCNQSMFFELEYEMIAIITTNIENSLLQINYYVNRISKSEQHL